MIYNVHVQQVVTLASSVDVRTTAGEERCAILTYYTEAWSYCKDWQKCMPQSSLTWPDPHSTLREKVWDMAIEQVVAQEFYYAFQSSPITSCTVPTCTDQTMFIYVSI